jgi:hypothetical protein
MNANTTMTTYDSGRRNRLRKAGRHRAYSGSRNREIWKRSIARDQDGATQEDAAFGSSRAAFVAGAKATAPVLVALVPFALAFGTMTVGGGSRPSRHSPCRCSPSRAPSWRPTVCRSTPISTTGLPFMVYLDPKGVMDMQLNA